MTVDEMEATTTVVNADVPPTAEQVGKVGFAEDECLVRRWLVLLVEPRRTTDPATPLSYCWAQ